MVNEPDMKKLLTNIWGWQELVTNADKTPAQKAILWQESLAQRQFKGGLHHLDP